MTTTLRINDLFWTLQGEGKHAGRRALFVRMPFCDLACSWCDTQFNSFKEWTELAFMRFAESERARFAVLTGGEPAMHKDSPRVIHLLRGMGFTVAIETNGHFKMPSDELGWITVSPKRDAGKFEPYYVHPEVMEIADEFKYVVDEGFDFAVLDRHDVTLNRRYSLSPEFGGFAENVKRILDYQKENPAWLLSLQTHKWLGIP